MMEHYVVHQITSVPLWPSLRQDCIWIGLSPFSLAGQTPHPRGEESGQMPIPSSFLTGQELFNVLIDLDA